MRFPPHVLLRQSGSPRRNIRAKKAVLENNRKVFTKVLFDVTDANRLVYTGKHCSRTSRNVSSKRGRDRVLMSDPNSKSSDINLVCMMVLQNIF